ncbi:MAG TPA: tetratricopeptide repeat protein [Bryobacteraceae bacterium]|nr:tetratricopeptide repeat protein [Bryobacteraceae bacterium]
MLLAAALIPFCGSLGSGFHFDDYAIFQDAAIRAPHGWFAVWNLRQTRPLTYFSFWLNYHLNGQAAAGYHAFNLLFHAAAALLLYECLRRIAPSAALFASLLFALHPLQSEPVNYIWARSIVLAALFTFASWRDWLEGRVWRATALFALALLAKEECAAFPLALVCLEWPLPRNRSRDLALTAMFVLSLLAAVHVLYALAITPGAPAGLHAGITPFHYFLAQGPVIWRYLRLAVLPFGFTVDPEITVPPAWLGIAAWFALAAAAVLLWRYSRWFAVALVLLLPSSSIFPAEDLAADRRMYLALAAVAVAATQFAQRVKCPAWLGGVVLALFAVVSVSRTSVWMSDERLWREAVAASPDKVRPKVQLARNVAPAEALSLLADARRIAPNDPAIATETGKTLLCMGNAAAALSEFGRALALDPRNPEYYNNRGVALAALGQRDAARQDFEHALQIAPDLMGARQNLIRLEQ